MMTEIRTDAFHLPPVIRSGFLEIDSADTLSVTKVLHSEKSTGEVSLTFWGEAEGPGAGFVMIQMFRLPRERAEFDRAVAFFGVGRKKWARLPDGVKSTPDTLAPAGVPAAWQHDGFPRAGHDMIHPYTSDEHALLIRYFGPVTMLDSPLFRPINDNLRVVEGRWERRPPECRRREGGEPGAAERPTDEAAAEEIADGVRRAHAYLELHPGQVAPGAVPQAIRDAVERLAAAKKRLPPKEAGALAIDLGCLWGQCLCDVAGWRWCELTYAGEPPMHAVVSPDSAHAVAPTEFLSDQLARRGRRVGNTILLLFNMITAGSLPIARPRAFLRLR